MNTNDLKKLQNVELEILQIVDVFCSKYGIQYSLYAGTALGAVRHKGFIPWDDDVDIAMTRENFNRFCTTWEDHPVSGYSLSCLQYDDYCGTCHAKVHKDNTVLLSEGEVESIGNHGIWLDIFPIDKVGDEKNQKQVFRNAKKLILLARANTVITNDSLTKRIARKSISMLPKKYRKARILSVLKWLSENDVMLDRNYKMVSLSATYAFKYRFPEGMTKRTEKIEFNGHMFDIYSDYDRMLSIIYGDYMQLPPKEKRVCTHNPVKVQF